MSCARHAGRGCPLPAWRVGWGVFPPFVFVSLFLVLSRFATKSMARRILGGWSGCTLMWFHVLSVVAVRSMNVRDPNWGTLGAFLGPLVDQWNCKRSGVQLTNAEHGGSASCEWGGGAANLSMLLDVLSAVAPTRRPACLVGNAECAEQLGKWIGMNGQEARATAYVHLRNAAEPINTYIAVPLSGAEQGLRR